MAFRTALLVAALIFVVTVVARLPAQLLASHLPAQVHCEEPTGTIWHGNCAQLTAAGLSVPGLSWTLHPSALLRLAVNLDLTSIDPSNGGSANVVAKTDGTLTATALTAQLPIGQDILPAGSTGLLSLALPSLVVRNGRLSGADGKVELRNLHLDNPALDLGSFQLQLVPDAADATTTDGQLRDLEGPLAVDGQLRLQSDGKFDINGTVASRATATDDLNRTLQMFLGPADAQGHHPFSLSGTL